MTDEQKSVAIKVIDGAIKYLRKGWTHRTLAEDVMGNTVEPTSVFACKWCAVGALQAECQLNIRHVGKYDEYYYAVKRALNTYSPEGYIGAFNDYSAKNVDEVIAVFEAAKAEFA